MSDRDRISEIKARLDAATPGPWRARRTSWESYNKDWNHPEHWGIAAGEESWHDNEGYFHPDDARYARDEIEVVEISYDRDYQTAEGAITKESDANFIAAAPDDITYLLAEITRLESLIPVPRECPLNHANRGDGQTVQGDDGLAIQDEDGGNRWFRTNFCFFCGTRMSDA